jgi:ATP-dependent protease ClpP protease subunit
LVEREVYLIGRIDEEKIDKLRERVSKLLEEDREKEITLFICSGGGNGDVAIGFYDWIKLKNIPLSTVAIGPVSSAAIIIFLSGRKRKAAPHSWFLIHRGGRIKYEIWKNLLRILSPRRYREEVDWEKIFNKLEEEIIEKETKLSKETVKTAVTKAHLMLTSEKAKEVGLVDEVIQT